MRGADCGGDPRSGLAACSKCQTPPEDRYSPFEKPHESLALDRAWGSQVIAGTVHAPGSPFIGERIWPLLA